ncbi:ABC transporter permease [Microbacterium candidum]|uniref:ABC transporter permease n=1 Tax=Microbacterium candidum TaxID=3041922 RepID=A0ABT7MVE3_9MICO|nr:ABC transporter permease [Microbacterium sp. ASV49]MDL9978427.1 ABC transporter permease [Microbacterium sp. ASV49]
MNGIFAQVFTIATLAVILTKTAPLLLAAIGGAFTQMGSILNIGLEGMMLVGAFAAIVVGAVTNPFIGIIGAIAAALILALVFALATLTFKADFIVVGIGINLLAAGVTVLLLTVMFGNAGVTPGNIKAILPKIDLGALAYTPIIGPMLNDQTLLVWLAFLLVPVYSYVLYRTPYGVHLRAVGEDESAARAAGINVTRVKFISILLSGAFCGIAGAQLAMSTVGSFTAGMTASRGFIAVAALTFGLGRPYFTMLACLIFGAADALADRLALAGVNSSLALTTPYVITIIALVLAALRVRSAYKARARKALASVGV